MVATLVRLRLLLLGNQLRRSTWQLIATILGGLYGLGMLALIVTGLVVLGFTDPAFAQTVVVLAGSAVILGWTVIPVLTAGIDQTVDPARLAPFPVSVSTLVPALTVSGVLGIPGVVTLLASLGTVGTWIRSPLAALAAVVCAVIGTVTAVVGSRMLVAVASRVGSGRRAREARFVLVFIPLVLLGPIILGVANLLREVADVLPGIARVLSFTPLGAIWAVPGDVAAGRFGQAALSFAIGVATLAVMLLVWRWALARALERPAQAAAARADRRGSGLFGVLPGTPWGAVAARSLTYWIRDPRYAQSLISVPLIPALIFFYGGTNGNLGALLWVGPIVGVLLSMSIYTDVSYDSTAYALHLQTGVRGWADRAGRVLALALFAVPVTLLLTVGGVAVLGEWAMLPGLLGITIGVLLSGFAVSSLISGAFVFPVPAPGENPFKSRSGGGFSLLLSMLATGSALAVLVLPELILAIVGFATGDPLWGVLSIVVGLVLGSVLLVLGIRIGGRIVEARGPGLLSQLQRQR